MDDIYREIEEEVQYEMHQKRLQKKFKKSHDLGITLNKFKRVVEKNTDTSFYDEDMWTFDFESWCEYLEAVSDEAKTVEEFCKNYYY